jgi:hypothetical protein
MSTAQELVYNRIIELIRSLCDTVVIRPYQGQTIPSNCIVVRLDDMGAIGCTEMHKLILSINCYGENSAQNAALISFIPKRFKIDGATLLKTGVVKDLTDLEQGAFTSRHHLEMFGRYKESLTIDYDTATGVEGVEIEH